MTCEFSSTLLKSRSTGPPAASVEASGFIWSTSGTKLAAAPTAPTVAVAMNRKSRRVDSGPWPPVDAVVAVLAMVGPFG